MDPIFCQDTLVAAEGFTSTTLNKCTNYGIFKLKLQFGVIYLGGGGEQGEEVQFFLGGRGKYLLHAFPNIGSRAWIFFRKLGVLGTKIWEICVLEAEILAKNKVEKSKIFLKIEIGMHMSSTLRVKLLVG